MGMLGAIARKDRVLGHFGWQGEPVTVRTRLRPDGSVRAGVDFFDRRGHLLYSTTQQVGTLADALAAFADWQERLDPSPVYPGPAQGESAPDAWDQVQRVQATDPMARIGLFGFAPTHRGWHGA